MRKWFQKMASEIHSEIVKNKMTNNKPQTEHMFATQYKFIRHNKEVAEKCKF